MYGVEDSSSGMYILSAFVEMIFSVIVLGRRKKATKKIAMRAAILVMLKYNFLKRKKKVILKTFSFSLSINFYFFDKL